MAAKYNIEVKVCDNPGGRLQGRRYRRGAYRLRSRGDRRPPAREGRPHRRGRRQWQAGRRVPATGRCLPAVRRHAGAGRAPELATDAEHIGYEARPLQAKYGDGRRGRRKHGNSLPDRRVTLADLVQARCRGAPRPTRSPIRSAATCKAPSSARLPAKSTSSPSAPASAGRFRPSGSCRTFAIELVCFGWLTGSDQADH